MAIFTEDAARNRANDSNQTQQQDIRHAGALQSTLFQRRYVVQLPVAAAFQA